VANPASPLLLATNPEPGYSWQLSAHSPIDADDPKFGIKEQSLRLSGELQEIAQYYHSQAPNSYSQRWIQANVNLERNYVRGRLLFASNTIEYGAYAPVPFVVSRLNWKEDPYANFNWQWYHHQLISVHYLLAVANRDHSQAAIDTAKAIVRSWAAANYASSSPSPMSWNDHATAYRLRTLLCFFECLRTSPTADPEFAGLLLRMIDTHCRVLADVKFYSRHTNHGFDQSIMLYWAARALPELADASGWLQLGRDRLRDEISFMFTSEGIHVENSPSYHIWLLSALEEIRFLLAANDRLSLESLISAGWEYAAYVLQPNGRLPLVGDTESRDFTKVRSSGDSPGFEEFLFSASGGKLGTRPLAVDRVFPRSGYAVFRDQWHHSDDFADSVYLFFKCSYLSDYHRHDDDLSLVLMAYGQEWLIDSGLYGYEEANPIRRYMRSAEAHNTILLLDGSAIRQVAELPEPGSGITSFGTGDCASYVVGRSRMWRGYMTERRIEYFKPRRIIIRDTIAPSEAGALNRPDFAVLFHTPTNKLIRIANNSQVIISSTNGHRLLLEFDPVPSQLRLGCGESLADTTPASWTSLSLTKLEPSQCLRFEFAGTNAVTCTLTLAPRRHQEEIILAE
jgi:hypothetical protein